MNCSKFEAKDIVVTIQQNELSVTVNSYYSVTSVVLDWLLVPASDCHEMKPPIELYGFTVVSSNTFTL